MDKIPKRYIPKTLSKKDREKQKKAIEISKKEFEKGKFKVRPKLESFKSRESSWTKKAKEAGIAGTPKKIADKLGRTEKRKEEILKGIKEIEAKGKAAYFTSGSRPNQTPSSWARARTYSVLFGGPSRKVDKSIVHKYKIPLLKE